MDPKRPVSNQNNFGNVLPVAHLEEKEVFHSKSSTKIFALIIIFVIIATALITTYLVLSLKSKVDQKLQAKTTTSKQVEKR